LGRPVVAGIQYELTQTKKSSQTIGNLEQSKKKNVSLAEKSYRGKKKIISKKSSLNANFAPTMWQNEPLLDLFQEA
jgi:hypothetical protein